MARVEMTPFLTVKDARGIVVLMREARSPIRLARLLLVGGGRGFMIDGVEIVGIDANAQSGLLIRRGHVSGLEAHRQ